MPSAAHVRQSFSSPGYHAHVPFNLNVRTCCSCCTWTYYSSLCCRRPRTYLCPPLQLSQSPIHVHETPTLFFVVNSLRLWRRIRPPWKQIPNMETSEKYTVISSDPQELDRINLRIWPIYKLMIQSYLSIIGPIPACSPRSSSSRGRTQVDKQKRNSEQISFNRKVVDTQDFIMYIECGRWIVW